MSAADNKAVFLSYASQDAVAVLRIAEALRAAGVEVWFDQNELVGGDAWDAKIRKQISECGLFVPVISAATQARGEGYFRLEWKLSVDRSHLMAHDQPFLLPVVIDATKDGEARVPPEFRAVQWTRLRQDYGGQARDDASVAAFCARVKKLLGGETAFAGSEVGARLVRAQEDGRGPAAPLPQSPRSWHVPAIVVAAAALIALALWQPWKKSAPAPAAPLALSPSNGLTEAQQLVAKARKIFDEGDDSNHENYFLADDLLKKALALDSTDGDVWAAQAELSAELVMSSYDRSAARQQNLRMQAERAVKLAPDSTETQLAYAYYLTVVSFLTPNGEHFASEAVASVEKLQLTDAQRPRGARVRLSCMVVLGRLDEWTASVERPDAPERNDARLLGIAATQCIFAGRYAEAEDFNARSMALRRLGRTQMVDVLLKLVWRGDLDGAAGALAQWPSWLALEDRGVFIASQVWLWRHEPDKAIAVLSPISRDFLNDSLFVGPKAVLIALAQEMAGNAQAARAAWEDTKRVATRVAAEQTADQRALIWKAVAMARLGETTEAETIFRQLEQSRILRSEFWSCTAPSALLRIALGHSADVVAKFDVELRSNSVRTRAPSPQAALRLNPVFDSIRATPEFQKWMAAAPTPKAMEASAAAALDPKSIAVLPFANRSPDPENAFFTDGVHEDILTNLGNIRELRVVSNTSVEQYRGTTKTMKQIGAELNVAYILEGSVQRVGNKVHVTGQLIDARTDAHLWAKSFDKDLSDVFVIQAELAKSIAAELRAVLSPEEQKLVERRFTENAVAYDNYLKARELWERGADLLNSVEPRLRRAVELDPNFAAAWAALAHLEANSYFFGIDATAARLTNAKTAIDTAQRLAPDAPEVILGLGQYYYYGLRDYARAIEQYEKLLRLRPNDSDVLNAVAAIQRRQGKWLEATATWRRSLESEPRQSRAAFDLTLLLSAARRYDEALPAQQRVVALQPGDPGERFRLAQISYLARGSTEDVEKIFAAQSAVDANSRAEWAIMRGDLPEALRLVRALRIPEPNGFAISMGNFSRPLVLALNGDTAGVHEILDHLIAELKGRREREAANARLWCNLGPAEALIGEKAEAVRCAERAVELLPDSVDAFRGPVCRANLAFVYAWTGDKDRAIAEYARLLRVPSEDPVSLNVYVMKSSLWYARLRGDPKFEALLNDPKNNEPLF